MNKGKPRSDKKNRSRSLKRGAGASPKRAVSRKKTQRAGTARPKGKVRLGVRVYGRQSISSSPENAEKIVSEEEARPLSADIDASGAARDKTKSGREYPLPNALPDRGSYLANLAEREKRLVMWSGVVFFMLLILFVWWASGDFFRFSPLPAEAPAEAKLDFGEAKEELASVFAEMKKGIGEIKAELNKATSTDLDGAPIPETDAGGEGPAPEIQLEPEDGNAIATSADKIKALIEHLENNFE